MNKDASVSCEVNIEWTNKQGILQKKFSNKKATLTLVRNESRDMIVHVSAEKLAPIKLKIKDINVHNKFMKEGKASIKFPEDNAMMFLCNAPPGQLLAFLKVIFFKMTGQKTPQPQSKSSLRTAVLNKPNQLEEISPVTNAEYVKTMKKMGKSTETTPSPLARKRKLENTRSDKAPAAKKLLYSGSPILNEPLDIEQQEVLDACLSGQNIFFTGSAGTGKSYLMKKIIGALPPDVTIATASTGVAACHIGGITLHQFAGIGTGEASIEACYKKASKSATAALWRRTKHLIIDEISMVDGDFFEKIEKVARMVRNSDKPFGGIQLILCGDFLQLPPVNKQDFKSQTLQTVKFCFQSPAWDECRLRNFELQNVHRQSDHKFIRVLNKIRKGQVDQEVTDSLAATAKQNIERDGILATRLCTHTKDADIINESKLKALTGESKFYDAQDLIPGSTRQLDQQTPVPAKLELKIGAQVMLLKNIDIQAGLVNGARGVVKSFKNGLPSVQFKNKREYVPVYEKFIIKTAGGAQLTRKQLPLKLAWAFSIHKSQGLTLDCVEMSLGRVFEAGQAYVALSRAQSLEALRVLDFKPTQVWANPDVLKFYRNLDQTRLIPLGPTNVNGNRIKSVPKKKLNFSKKLMEKPLVTIS